MKFTGRAGNLAVAAALVVAASAAAGEARAQQREQTAAARALFREGVELADREQWSEAADRFRRSLALRPSTVVAYNLGTALVHTGELVEASELFRRAVRDDSAPDRLRAAARRELREVEGRVGRLTIEVEGPREGVELRLDDRAVAPETIGVAVPADPGERVVAAVRDEREVARAEVTVPEGGAVSVSLEVPPPAPEPEPDAQVAAPSPEETARAAAPEPAPAEPAPVDEGSDDTALWVGVAVGILAAIGAAALTAYLVIDAQGPADPIEGNLLPGSVEFGP